MVKFGDIDIDFSSPLAQLNTNTPKEINNLLISSNKIFLIGENFSNITTIKLHEDGTPALLSSGLNWYINYYNELNDVWPLNGKSVPYGIFNKDGKDYLFGQSHTCKKLYVWEINESTSNLENMKTYPLNIADGHHLDRACWNGKGKLFFLSNITNSLYMVDISDFSCRLVANHLTYNEARNAISLSYKSAFTSMYVNGDYIYISGDPEYSSDSLLRIFSIKEHINIDGLCSSSVEQNARDKIENYKSAVIDSLNNRIYFFKTKDCSLIESYRITIDRKDYVQSNIILCQSKEVKGNSVKDLKIQDNSIIDVNSRVNLLVRPVIVPTDFSGNKYNVRLPGDETFTKDLGAILYRNNLPSTPSTPTLTQNAVRAGGAIGIRWEDSTDKDKDPISYEVELFDGEKWRPTETSKGSTLDYTIPSDIKDTKQAKFRIRAFDGKDYSSDYCETSVFTIYRNNVPSNPSAFLSPTSGESFKPLDKIKVKWGESHDSDEKDKISYLLEFFDGEKWLKVTETSNTETKFTVPIVKGTSQAKFRVKSFDGRDYSNDCVVSNDFTIQDVDLSTVSVPNSLEFDGKSSKVTIDDKGKLNTRDSITFVFSGRLYKTNYTYDIISRVVNENKIGYKVSVTPFGSLNVSYTNSHGETHDVSDVVDLTGSWRDIIISIDTKKSKVFIYSKGVCNSSINIEHGSLCDSPDAVTYLGYDIVSQKHAKMSLGYLGIFDGSFDTSKIQELSLPLTGEEKGLIAFFNSNKTDFSNTLSFKDITATIKGDFQWGFKFSPLSSIKLPSSNYQSVVNIEYLRKKVDEFREINGVNKKQWTDIIHKDFPIKAIHWNELKTGILDVYTKLGVSLKSDKTLQDLSLVIQSNDPRFEIRNLPSVVNCIISGLLNK